MRSFLALILVFASLQAQARILLVSDIDDTVKLANVLDLANAAVYSFDDKSSFVGMSELYNSIVKDRPDTDVLYLSRAPEWFMKKTHTRFLKNRNFPQGLYVGRTKYSSAVHKLNNIREQIRKSNPDTVIMVGDNGEQDADVYAQITQEFAHSGIRFLQFVRIAYNQKSSLFSGQVGFVTPLEVALDLEKEGVLQASSVQSLVSNVLPKILSERGRPATGQVAFPNFVKCKNFVWTWDEELERFPELVFLKTRINSVCR